MRNCATCGDPLAYSGRGRPPVTHTGSCAKVRANAVDESRREERYRAALSDAAVRAPFIDPAYVLGDVADDESLSIPAQLQRAGFNTLRDDVTEDRPYERARSQHRRQVLDSLGPRFAPERRKVTPAKAYARSHAVADCFGCPLFDHLAVAHSFTSASLAEAQEDEREDARLRSVLADGTDVLMREVLS